MYDNGTLPEDSRIVDVFISSLLHYGYLTVVKTTQLDDITEYDLVIPNQEVRSIF